MAAAASIGARRAQERAEKIDKEFNAMSDVEKIRLAREQRRELQRATSHTEAAAILKKRNLDPSLWRFPFKQYLYLAHTCNDIATASWFSNFILFCIVVAGALVGMQTYPEYENNKTIAQIDMFILIAFTLECALKILGEGMAPQNYFIGPEYAWNIFDFSIVTLSMPFIPFEGGQLKLLRLIRLMRLAKAFRKVPQLQMIMMGLIGGLKSIVYIVILMLLIFYLYACAGILFFKANDPFHFKSVEVSMLTLLGVATLDGWGEVMFINYFGCDVFSGGYYTSDKSEEDSRTGGVAWCGTPEAQPAVSALYFISFIVLSAFCILSLFIGAVAMSMVESMQEMKSIGRKAQDAEIASIRDSIIESSAKKHTLDRKQLRRLRLIELAFQGEDLRKIESDKEVGHGDRVLHYYFRMLAYGCQDLAENSVFSTAMTFVIVLAGVTVGVGTDQKMVEKYQDLLDFLEITIQYVFLSEIIIKVLGEEYKPYRYFKDSWNCFDFIVVAGSFLLSGGSLVTILRLLRLLRVLKLLRALPQLTMIVAALLKGATAIVFISVILSMFYFFFGIIAITFFGDNDVWHFGTLHMAMLSLFQASTMDNWSGVMWISLYGCDVQDGDRPELCTQPSTNFAMASFFFMTIILVGALVLVTLFIGVVGMSMEEASQEQKKEKEIEERAFVIGEVESLDEQTIRLFKEVFDSMDLIQCMRVGADEMKFGLKLAGLNLDEKEFADVWSKVDRDNSNGIDFAEFLEFMCDLRSNLHRLTEEEEGDTEFTAPKGIQRRQFTFVANIKEGEDAHSKATSIRNMQAIADDRPDDEMDEMFSAKKTWRPPVMTAAPAQGAAYATPVPMIKPQPTDKQKQFSVGRDMNRAAKTKVPGRASSAEKGTDADPMLLPQPTPNLDGENQMGDATFSTPKQLPKQDGKVFSSHPLQKAAQSPTGEVHNYTVSRAQSSFQKIQFGTGADGIEHDVPESGSPVSIRISPSGKSPYAPGSAVKRPVKSLVVSI